MESASSSGVTGCKRKRSVGRQKIAIEQIQDEGARQVSFSKRRNGLFKKAHELAVLCGAHIKVLVFSPGGKPYSFIHPSNFSTLPCHVSLPDCPSSDHNIQLIELHAALESTKRKKVQLKGYIEGMKGSLCGADVAGLGLAELEAARMELERVRADLVFGTNKLAIQPYLVPVGYESDAFYCGASSGYGPSESSSSVDLYYDCNFGLLC